MIATAISEKMDEAIPSTGLPAVQNVLLVYCNKAEADQFARYLGDICHLFPVRTERHLLNTLENHAIQMIIIKVEAGGAQSGVQLCSRLKSTLRFAHLPVILLIAANSPEVRICCLESGADAWMEMPLSRSYLRAQVRNLFANRHRLDSYFSQSRLFKHPIACSGDNEAFLNRLNNFIVEHLPDTGLNVDTLARLMNMSRPTLYRKIKCISHLSPNELVNTIRLNKAAELLSSGNKKVLEIAKLVGFHSRSNFGKAFIRHFSVTPMEYRKTIKI